jgi:hypothetical protein
MKSPSWKANIFCYLDMNMPLKKYGSTFLHLQLAKDHLNFHELLLTTTYHTYAKKHAKPGKKL